MKLLNEIKFSLNLETLKLRITWLRNFKETSWAYASWDIEKKTITNAKLWEMNSCPQNYYY